MTSPITTPPGMSEGTNGFQAPHSMTPHQLGDTLARLVWESFSDFIADGDAEVLLGDLGLTREDGIPAQAPTEEILIFLMWAHTRGIQLAFAGRSGQGLVRESLDAFHGAIFQDMVENGTPPAQLPLFEQRVGARYAEYYAAAERSDQDLGAAVAKHLARSSSNQASLANALTERALEVANPLRDFLEEVELVP